MSYLSTPVPDEPNPPGVTPNAPKDPSVYGDRWGPGGEKPEGKNAPDRPKKIETPDEGDTPQAGRTAPPTTP